MGWVYLDDRFPEHPKVLAAGDDAAWMFVCGIAYTNRGPSDGLIPKAVIPRLTGLKQPLKVAQRLVDVGLWHDKDDCFAIHDYEIWNAETMARRAKARKAANVRWERTRSGNAQALPEHPPSTATAMQYPSPQSPVPKVLTPVSNSRAAVGAAKTGTGCSATIDETETEPTVAGLSHRLATACTAVNRDIATLESRNVVHWAIRHVDTRLIEDAVIWAETRPAGQQLALPRGLVPTIRSKAKDRGIAMPDFDPRKFA